MKRVRPALAALLLVSLHVAPSLAAGEPSAPEAGSTVYLLPGERLAAAVEPGGAHAGLRPGAPGVLQPEELGEMRLDDGTAALRYTSWGGTRGAANRFDPMDSWDADQIPPRALRILRIHFQVESGTGPMEWHVWEDNGGHKPDDARDLMTPVTVTAAPGWNTLDLEAMSVDVRIDPPRMFEVGIFNIEDGVTPMLWMDDGLPYVGGTGDFHGAVYSEDTQYCPGWKWFVMATGDIGDGEGPRSPVFMIWLEVDFDDPPAQLSFTDVTDIARGGSRVAWGDYDGDGWEDLLIGGARLYRNDANPPDVTFTEVTGPAGLTNPGGANGGIFGDYDNDGDLDIFQTNGRCEPCQNSSFGMDRLFENNGNGTFTDRLRVEYADDRGAPLPHDVLPTEGAAWGDFNGDGYLDIYAANHVDWDTGECWQDYLWINDGPPAYTFTDASVASGVRSAVLCGRGVAPVDFDGDTDQDVFVTNYRLERDLLWVNTGNDGLGIPQLVNEGQARGVEGVEKPSYGAYGHGVGGSWGDVDHDGDLDLVVGNLAHSGWLCFSDISMLFESSGEPDPVFTDIAGPAGLIYNELDNDASFADWNNDGWLDILLTHTYDGWRNGVYRALGTVPPTFEEVSHDSGIYARSCWGSAWGDYDRDGDLDLACKRLFRNNADAYSTNHWLQVEVEGVCVNRDGIGSRVWVEHDGVTQMSEVYGTRGTSSQDSRIQHFGLGASTTASRVTVRFPNGTTVERTGVAADQRILVVEPDCLVALFQTEGIGFRSDPDTTCVGIPLQFHDASRGDATGWEWDFDGDTVYDVTGDPDPVWSWDSSGTYAVTLHVTTAATTSDYTADIDVLDPVDPGVTDPGNVLRAMPPFPSRTSFEWFRTMSIPPAGGDYALIRTESLDEPGHAVTPDGHRETFFSDDPVPGGALLFYRVVVRDPGGCPADDPHRP